MDHGDVSRFNSAVELLAGAFRHKLEPVTLAAYWTALSRFDISDIERAVASLIGTAKFMPNPAEIIEAVQGGNADDVAVAAWQVVVEAQAIGAYKAVSFQVDPLINAAIRNLGGWPAMFDSCCDAQGEGIYRARFLKTYAALRRQSPSDEACRPLKGISDASRVERDAQGEVIGETLTYRNIHQRSRDVPSAGRLAALKVLHNNQPRLEG